MAPAEDFYLLLEGSRRREGRAGGSRVVLLHGWLQSSDVWLSTAARLRDTHGHDVLLLDWLGHGRSRGGLETLSVAALHEQLLRVLRRVGWDAGPRLVVAGMSLGGAMAVRLATFHPERVGKLLLICSAGLDEGWWALPSLTAPLRHGLLALDTLLAAPLGLRRLPLVRWLLAQLRLISTTPTYGLPEDVAERLAVRRLPMALVWGTLDWVHTAQVHRWRGGRPAAEVPSTEFPLMGHMQLCTGIDALELWQSPELWREGDFPQDQPQPLLPPGQRRLTTALVRCHPPRAEEARSRL